MRPLLANLPNNYQLGDIEALPFIDASFDSSWSNLAVQWCGSLSRALAELQRVTRPGVQVLFSTLGPSSFMRWGMRGSK